MVEQSAAGDRGSAPAQLDFVAPWADGPIVMVDLTGAEPVVRVATLPPGAHDLELGFVAPWADGPPITRD